MAENSMKPRIRFKGYTDAWEQRKLGELGFFKSNGVDKKINPNEVFVNLLNYMDVYNRRHITAKNCVELMQVTAKPQQVKDNDVQANDVFFTPTSETADDIGHVLVIEETLPNTVYSYHLMRYRPFDGKFYPTFPNYEFESGFVRYQIVLNAQGVQRFVLNREAFEQLEIRKPDYAEQEKISKFLSQLDNMSVLYQQKHDKILNIKKALLEKMFPSDTETTPKIRFKGVNDAWEQRKLGEVGKAQSGVGFPDREQGGKTGVPFYKVSDMNNAGNEHEMCSANNYVSEAQCKKNGWMPITEISVVFAKVGAAIMLNRKRLVRISFLLDNNTMAYKFGTEWDIDFGKTLFERIDLTDLVQIGALPSYNATDVECVEISMPDKPEQHRIGVFFKQLDNLITLHQRQLEKLKNIKSALLEKMFV